MNNEFYFCFTISIQCASCNIIIIIILLLIIIILLEKIDDQMRAGMEKLHNIELNDIQWKQATLPIGDGRLGIR